MFEKYRIKQCEKEIRFLEEETAQYNRVVKQYAISCGFEKEEQSGVYVKVLVYPNLLLALRTNHTVYYFELIFTGENNIGHQVPVFLMKFPKSDVKNIIAHYIADTMPYSVENTNLMHRFNKEFSEAPVNYRRIKDLKLKIEELKGLKL